MKKNVLEVFNEANSNPSPQPIISPTISRIAWLSRPPGGDFAECVRNCARQLGWVESSLATSLDDPGCTSARCEEVLCETPLGVL